MHLCLFEDDKVEALRPLIETRAAYDLRSGPRTLLEAACDAFRPNQLLLHARSLVAGVTALAHDEALVNRLPEDSDVLFVNGRFVTDGSETVTQLQQVTDTNEPRVFVQNRRLVAAWVPDATDRLPDDLLSHEALPLEPFGDFSSTTLEEATLLERPWHLIDHLRPALDRGIAARTESSSPSRSLQNRSHASVHESVVTVNPEQIYLEPGVTVRPGAILNAEDGPIYLGADATVFERAVVRGPCYLGPKSQAKIGANLEGLAGGTWSKLGGEVHDTIIQSYSNKGHAGFLGDSYLGSWCNLGADTNTSNLKNDYGEVTVYAPNEGDFMPTGRQFAGLFMGDHSKCGINTMFNTGAVVGACCNIYGSDFPPRYLPPFSWGSPTEGFTEYRLDKVLQVAERVMARRDRSLSDARRSLLATLFQRTQDERAAHHG